MMIEFGVVAFAVARLTRLLVVDEVTKPARQTLVRRLPEGSPWAYLLFCRWCMSVWVAFPVAAAWWVLTPTIRWSGHWLVDVVSVALALSYVTGLLVRAEPEA